jgi:asparagine synthase (glutamine-hydrolysing)
MCGICGVVQVSGDLRTVASPDVVERMTDSMTHRGPDDRGIHIGPGIAIGARRLSIVDVAAGHQPLCNEDGRIWAAQNGELYNHLELRESLVEDGHTFETRCDTEVIPHLYERFGVEFPKHLFGKFAIAVWDADRRRAVLARDRVGVKPLYYARVGDLVVFGSELKAVLASGCIPLDLDHTAIQLYLTLGYIPGPRTPLAAVSKLMPGHVLVVEDGDVRSQPYWTFPEPHPESRPLADWSEGLIDVLERSVRRRLMSDVPLGAMLSGGLDSSLIVALMARNLTDPVKTFSIGFAEDGEHNELEDARAVADHFGTEHHELTMSMTAGDVSLETLVWHLDEPLFDLSALGFYWLSELASKHVTVALSGQGADELLGGYRKHRVASLLRPLSRLPHPLRAVPERLVPGRRIDAARAARALAARDPAERLLAMSALVDNDLRDSLLTGSLAGSDDSAARDVINARLGQVKGDPLLVTLYLDAQLALVDDMLQYFDRTSMAHSLEVRVPFLDHEVVEYCARVPADLKVHGRTTKYLLKTAARGLVPDQIIDKRKLGFFRGASAEWLRRQLEGPGQDYLLASEPLYAEFVDPSVVADLVRRHEQGDHGRVHLLLAILVLEVWLQTYLPSATSGPAPAIAAVGG